MISCFTFVYFFFSTSVFDVDRCFGFFPPTKNSASSFGTHLMNHIHKFMLQSRADSWLAVFLFFLFFLIIRMEDFNDHQKSTNALHCRTKCVCSLDNNQNQTNRIESQTKTNNRMQQHIRIALTVLFRQAPIEIRKNKLHQSNRPILWGSNEEEYVIIFFLFLFFFV